MACVTACPAFELFIPCTYSPVSEVVRHAISRDCFPELCTVSSRVKMRAALARRLTDWHLARERDVGSNPGKGGTSEASAKASESKYLSIFFFLN